ncbi:hypothetical protein AURDEDRAFT_115431 [Auricularia subglabra TFB-10046 SS5]|nr:hypothetical protein AURDEDRAFT_115431 [Auricularia subglabra TFB-10046 SS5]
MLAPLFSSLLLAAGLANAKSYNLLRYSGGKSFYDAWVYPATWDTTNNVPQADVLNNGDDFLANKTHADKFQLTTVNDAGNAVLRVDTGPVDFNQKRFSVRIESKEFFGLGTVFVLDAGMSPHIPFGCSVWPAYWTSASSWPSGGEIDILENVNQATNNQMALHTQGACQIEADPTSMSGALGRNNCTHDVNDNSGCVVKDPSNQSFGAGFNSNNGGVWVTEFAEDAISIWFFTRGSVPNGLDTKSNSSSIDTSTLGTPTARFPSTGCDIKSQFQPQKVIINISLCGDFARPLIEQTCAVDQQENPCYTNYVIGNGSNFQQAFFEIASHRVFSDGAVKPQATNPDPNAGDDSSSGGNGGGNGGTGGDNSGDNGLGGDGTGAASSRWSSLAVPATLAAVAIPALALL